MNFCSLGFSFDGFRWVIIKLRFHHRWTPFGFFFCNITVAIVTRFDNIRSFPRLPAPEDTIHFALDIKKILHQCCRVPEFHIPWPQTNAEPDWDVYQRPLYRAEGRSDVFSVVFTSDEKKKGQVYHSAAIQPKSMPLFAKVSQTLSSWEGIRIKIYA